MESFGKANNTFVKYFPSSTLMFLNIGVKGEGLYNLLSENKEFRHTVSIAKADEVKELFGSFNGDISAGLINVTMNSAPTFMMYADVIRRRKERKRTRSSLQEQAIIGNEKRGRYHSTWQG